MLTLFMEVLPPMVGNGVISDGVCKADEVIHIRPNNWPDVSPVYSSYYNKIENKLYIYALEKNTEATVKVICEGTVVLLDDVLPGSQPAVYDFSNSNKYTLDYSSVFDEMFDSNTLTRQTGELFLGAILNCNSLNDVIYLANNYIDTIESYGDFETYEKESLYSCFTIAVYSYHLWSELITDDEKLSK